MQRCVRVLSRGAAGGPAARVEREAHEHDENVVRALRRLPLFRGQVVAERGAHVRRSGEREAREHIERDVRRGARRRDERRDQRLDEEVREHNRERRLELEIGVVLDEVGDEAEQRQEHDRTHQVHHVVRDLSTQNHRQLEAGRDVRQGRRVLHSVQYRRQRVVNVSSSMNSTFEYVSMNSETREN